MKTKILAIALFATAFCSSAYAIRTEPGFYSRFEGCQNAFPQLWPGVQAEKIDRGLVDQIPEAKAVEFDECLIIYRTFYRRYPQPGKDYSNLESEVKETLRFLIKKFPNLPRPQFYR